MSRTKGPSKNEKHPVKRFWIVYFSVVFVLTVAAFVTIKTLNLYMVVGESMEPTLTDGQLICTEKDFTTEDLKAGLIVCVSAGEDKILIKRIVAVPGDTVRASDGWIYINGEAYIYSSITKDFDEIALGNDEYFCLGDNIDNSRDSRYYGPFTFNDIEAIVIKSLFKGEIY